MTAVQQLRTPALARAVAAARAAVEEAAAVPVGSLDRFEVSEGLAELVALEAQATELRLRLLAEADRRELADQEAATDTAAWAAKLTGTTRGVMAGGLWLARLLKDRYHATREAFAAGTISLDQVRVIVRAAERMPEAATPEQRTAAEEALVAKATAGMNARRLRQVARRMLERLDRELADRQEADMLDEEEQHAQIETWLTLHDNGDGTTTGRFVIPELHGQLLRAALERLSSPRRLSRNRAGDLVTDPTLPGTGPGLNWSESLGAAFTELLEHLPTHGHGPNGATMLVHIDHQHLQDQLAAARLDTGTRISARQARRLACNAGIIPIVLGADSDILDQGRERRLHTTAQRRALSVHHETCATEGCERPFAWCEIHHPDPWSQGGPTDLTNALPLCGYHHQRAHDPHYTLTITPTGEARFRRRPRH